MIRDTSKFATNHGDISSSGFGRKSAFRNISLVGISIVLVLTVAVAVSGNILPSFGLSRQTSMLENAGGVHLSLEKLKNHVLLPMHKGHTRYWLGPISGLTYTTNCVTPGVLRVGYYQSQQLRDELRHPLIIVSAFESEALFDSSPRPLIIDSESRVVNAKGDLLSYHSSSMSNVTIRQNASGEVITITYATPTTAETMVQDSERLSRL